MLKRIISGGQTGVDRAALDVAIELGVPCGGWCPRGRLAEDGPIPESYPLRETPTDEYPERTERNVCAADGTLVLKRGKADRGTALTMRLANKHRKPLYVVDLEAPYEVDAVRAWVEAQAIGTLNVAGPRESSQDGVYAQAREYLSALLGA
jgi:hypothetical protein